MYCKRCGRELTITEMFCAGCGAKRLELNPRRIPSTEKGESSRAWHLIPILMGTLIVGVIAIFIINHFK